MELTIRFIMCLRCSSSPGEIHVWNTGVEGDPRLASSGFTDLGHKEPVAKVVVITLRVAK